MSKLYFFANGNTAFFDKDDKQVPVLQQPWIRCYMRYLLSQTSIKVDLADLEIRLPDGAKARWLEATDQWEILGGD